MKYVVPAMLVIVAIIHLLPLSGVLSRERDLEMRSEPGACAARAVPASGIAHRSSNRTSAVLVTLAVRPGAVCQVQYIFVCAITLSGGGIPYPDRSSVVCASFTSTVS